MASRFTTSKQKFIAGFLAAMAGLFFILTFWSFASGETIFRDRINEPEMEPKKLTEPHGTFTVDDPGPIQLTADASTSLNDTWLWVKTVVLDEEDHKVFEESFNLSYYSGSGWEEGDPEKSTAFFLPKGKYKLLVYAEDTDETARRGHWTDGGRTEHVNIVVEQGVVLTRYFLILAIIFGVAGIGYSWWCGQRRATPDWS